MSLNVFVIENIINENALHVVQNKHDALYKHQNLLLFLFFSELY